MKKILILLLVLIAGGAIYYFGFGSQKIVETLKNRVDTQLQVLQKNGFVIEDRKIEAKSEHFVINYKDPAKIAHYFRSKNIDLSDEDADALKGLKIGVGLQYLKGAYSAVSADLYPIAFPPALIQMKTEQGRSELARISKEKIFLIHIDINKLFNAFQGYIKDIDENFKDVESIKIISKGFKFSGSFNNEVLNSSSHTLDKLSISDEHGTEIAIEKMEGSYKHGDKNLYDFSSNYTIETLLLHDKSAQQEILLKSISLHTTGTAQGGHASSHSKLTVKSIALQDHQEKHYLEDITGKFSLENISIKALEQMQKLDSNDTEGFNQAFKMLLSEGVVLKIDEFSAKKIRGGDGTMVDGFAIQASIKTDKVTDFKQLRENPFLFLDIIDASVHMEFSNEIYLILQKRPEIAIMTLLFSPVSKNHRQVYDLEYKNGSLKINGKPLI